MFSRQAAVTMRSLAGIALLLTAAACGDFGAPPAPALTAAPSPAGSPSDAPSQSPGSVRDHLKIVYDNGQGSTVTWTLTCEPIGGNHPDAQAACAALAAQGSTALPAVPPTKACTQVHGGPQTATVTGTWRQRNVTAQLNRINGCEIGRWDALTGLVPSASQ